MSKGKHYELTPVGILYSLKPQYPDYSDNAIKELFTYAQKIGKNAIRFKKSGEAVFVRIHKVK